MRNPIQNYAWGAKGKSAFIPKLLNIDLEKDMPYAELWMGAHPRASSEIEVDRKWQNLDHVIRKYPLETLGQSVVERFGSKLPFLFKVLSAAEPLSIQVHPDIEQAKLLHANDPVNYPDDNHKPEIAIALDYLKALVGFKSIEEIKNVLKSYEGFNEVLNDDPISKLISLKVKTADVQAKALESAYKHIINQAENSPAVFNRIIYKIVSQISGKAKQNNVERLFTSMYEKYGNDIGLIAILFFNFVELHEGEAIYTPAGIPHAYIEGNIIECMANSDNVIRAGLTSKFKDVKNLLDLMDYNPGGNSRVKPTMNDKCKIYKTTAAEFKVSYSALEEKDVVDVTNSNAKIYLISKGALRFSNNTFSLLLEKGDVVFIPACLTDYEIKAELKCELFCAETNDFTSMNF